jgi:prephenate dehydrogenase
MPCVLVSGLGLMGGSLAAAASAAGWRVLLHHRRPEPIAAAAARGWGTPASDLTGTTAADLAVVCTPVEHIAPTVRQLAAAAPRTVLTDVGSVKGVVCSGLADLAARFVGSHPMCGSHRQGLDAADPQLYHSRTVIITPVPGNPPAALALVERLWSDLGCRVLRLDPDAHDRAVAAASHLPHVLANLAAQAMTAEAAPVAAGGFRDTTRVAAGGPELWAGILLANRSAVLDATGAASLRLAEIVDALRRDDRAALVAWLEAGRAGRARFDAVQ